MNDPTAGPIPRDTYQRNTCRKWGKYVKGKYYNYLAQIVL